MPSALYYPHTNIQDAGLLKTALLLWDEIDYIVPGKKFEFLIHKPTASPEISLMKRGLDVIGNPRIPTDDEKERVHTIVENLVKSGLPSWLIYSPQNAEANYEIYPEKLFVKTWRTLAESGFAVQQTEPAHGQYMPDWSMHKSIGLIIMAILAEVCGEEKDLVTDQKDSYDKWVRYLTTEAKGEFIPIEEVNKLEREITNEVECLVNVSLSTINIQNLDLKSLIELREKEKIGGDTVLPQLRSKYFEELKKYIERLKRCRSKTGRDTVENDFKVAMQRDLNSLKNELRLEESRTLWSGGLVTALTVGAGALASLALPIIGLPVAASVGIFGTTTVMATINHLAGVKKAHLDYKKDRNKVLKDHPMSYLYSIHNG